MARTLPVPTEAGPPPQGHTPSRLTALHRRHLAHGALLVEHGGWLLPRSYGRLPAEQVAVRQAVGLLDIGESGKVDLKSDSLDAVLGAVFPKIGAVAIGHSGTAGKRGSIRVCRLTGEQALLLTPPGEEQGTLASFSSAVSEHPCTHVVDVTGALAGMRLLGPNAPAVLERLCTMDLTPHRFANGLVAQCGMARIHALIARRDALGVPGYDIYVDRDLGDYLWECLLEAGAPLGIMPAGRDAEEKGAI